MKAIKDVASRARGAWSLLTVAGAVLIGGCNQAQVVNVWRDPSFEARPVRSVLVVSQRSDDIGRRLWEDALGQDLTDHGVTASPSYGEVPDRPLSKAEVTKALRSGEFDAALIVRPLPEEREARWVPGWTSYEPRTWYDPWRDRQVTAFRTRVHRGYNVVDRIARAQITVWMGGDDPRMVWAATVETVNPSTGDELRKDIASGLVPALTKAGLIPGDEKRAHRS